MPAAPAAPPAAPKPAAPIAPAKPSPEPAKPSAMPEDASAEIDRLASDGDQEAPKPPTPKKEDKPPEKPVAPDKPTETKPADAKPDDKAPTPDDSKPLTIPEMRKRIAQLNAENAELKKKVQSNGAPKDDPEKTALTAKLTDTEKKLGEVEKEIKYANYEKSEEYQKEFVAPIEEAFQAAHADVSQFDITIEHEDGTVTTRKATPDEFTKLTRMESADAVRQAKRWFGDLAEEVLAHRRGLIKLNQRRQGAIEKFRTEAGERDKTRLADVARQRENYSKAWTALNKEIIEAAPELYNEDEADPEGNAEFEKGKAIVQKTFSNDLPIEEVMKAKATVLNHAAAFPRLLHRHNKLKARAAELEKELEEFKKSEPGGGDGGAPEGGAAPESVDAEIDRLSGGR